MIIFACVFACLFVYTNVGVCVCASKFILWWLDIYCSKEINSRERKGVKNPTDLNKIWKGRWGQLFLSLFLLFFFLSSHVIELKVQKKSQEYCHLVRSSNPFRVAHSLSNLFHTFLQVFLEVQKKKKIYREQREQQQR